MPALSTILFNTLIPRDAASIVNATAHPLKVVCAWPVSGQYGPGSRVLYYVLVAACEVAQTQEWLRNACLAAALLFPAIAAIHGIVLASVHVDGAVDMDVFGAFQFCSIGILAAPVTVRLSATYWNDPARNTIFLWTTLILAGLLSLTVEFYRSTTHACTSVPSKSYLFPYDINPTCNLTCSIEEGPFSPLRGGSVNNIYVIPAPERLTFGIGTLLAAACCIPALLSLASMVNKIIDDRNKDVQEDELISGTNATPRSLSKSNELIGAILKGVEIPLFTGAVLAILVVGELNLFSRQVRYQTEPMASIGQWAPIVGTGLAALGSLYVLLAKDMKAVVEESINGGSSRQGGIDAQSIHSHVPDSPSHGMQILGPQSMQEVNIRLTRASSLADPSSILDPIQRTSHHSHDSRPSSDRPSPHHNLSDSSARSLPASDAGNRRKVAKLFSRMGNFFDSHAQDWIDDHFIFKDGPASHWPTVPGEELRNPPVVDFQTEYNLAREVEGSATPVPRRVRSRPSSFTGSGPSGRVFSTPPGEGEGVGTSEGPDIQRPQAAVLQGGQTETDMVTPGGRQTRSDTRDTLEVPQWSMHRTSTVDSLAVPVTDVPEAERNPPSLESRDLGKGRAV